MTGTAHIIRGNALALPLPDASVDLCVTSPPYFGLRSYQDGGEHYAGQIGSEPTPAEFVDALIAATREMVRVLKPSGSIWVNLGDKYAGNGSGAPGVGLRRDEHMKQGARDGNRRSRPSGVEGVPGKSLIGIPWRYALRCIDDLGLILRAEVIWSKPNGLPESVTDRVRRSHEVWFHFTKEPRYFSAVDEIREAHQSPSTTLGRRDGANFGTHTSRTHTADGSRHTDGHPLGKLPGSVWTIATQPLQVPAHLGIDHFAAFPMEWPRRIIRGWSPAGVCSACGEGLTPVTAKEGGRPVARAHRHLPGYTDPAGEGMRDQSYRIEGYSCACRTWTPQGIASARTTASFTKDIPGRSAAAVDISLLTTPDVTATGTPGGDSAGTVTLTTASTTSTPPVLKPAAILDPFGGTGTTALMAKALGRTGISVDMSADYCRLAEWRTNDPGQMAAAMQVEKPDDVSPDQLDLFGDLIA